MEKKDTMYELELSVVAHRLSVEAEKKDFFSFLYLFLCSQKKRKRKESLGKHSSTTTWYLSRTRKTAKEISSSLNSFVVLMFVGGYTLVHCGWVKFCHKVKKNNYAMNRLLKNEKN